MSDKKASHIQLNHVSKTYFSSAADVQALNDIDLQLESGCFVGVVGKSGAGKSTLVNILTGVDRLTAGELWMDGIPLHTLNQEQLSRWRGKNVGVVYQSFELLNQLSILENVMLPMDLCGNYSPLRSVKKAMHLLEQVEIEDHARKSPAAISGGQRQRVAIARALANDPQLIVADEPTGSLDSQTSETILQIFTSLVAKGTTVVMVTHDNSLKSHFDHLIELHDGKVVAERRKAHG